MFIRISNDKEQNQKKGSVWRLLIYFLYVPLDYEEKSFMGQELFLSEVKSYYHVCISFTVPLFFLFFLFSYLSHTSFYPSFSYFQLGN